jgi:hypothetical protein
VVTLVLAATMNESAIDSLQNGISATVSAHFLKRSPVIYARCAVILLNIPLAVVGSRHRPLAASAWLPRCVRTHPPPPALASSAPHCCGLRRPTSWQTGLTAAGPAVARGCRTRLARGPA